MLPPNTLSRPSAVPAAATAAFGASPMRHIFFVLAASAALMGSIDTTIVAVAIPQLTGALDAPLTSVAWTLTVYQLVQVIMLPLAGKLSDSFGRKRVFLLCVGTFTVGSLLCGMASSIWMLVAARALQAVGGGGLLPSAIGVISDQYRERRAQARGLFTSVMPVGGIVGPNLGGYILEHWSWREMFFVNVPIGIIVFVGAWVLLTSDGPRTSRHIDVKGLALYSGALVLLLATMTAAADDPALWSNPLLWAAVLGSVGLTWVFLRHIKRSSDPVMDYGLVVKHPFLAANLYNFFFGAAVFGASAFIPSYAVYHFGMSPQESGSVLTPRALTMIGTSVVASLWVIKTGYRIPMLLGIVLVATTFFLLGLGLNQVQLGPVTLDGFWLMAAMLAVGGFGMGLSGPSASNSALDLAPDKAAALTGVRSMFRMTGGVLCISSIVLALSFFPDRGQGLAVVFVGLALLIMIAVPITLMIPDTARDRWRAEQRARNS